MAKKRVVKSERRSRSDRGRSCSAAEPRTRVGTQYTVTTPRRPEGKTFDNVDDAAKFFHVQVSLSGRRPNRAGDRAGQGLGQVGKTA